MSKKSAASHTPVGEFTFDNAISFGDFFPLEAPNGAGIDTSKMFSDYEHLAEIPVGYNNKTASLPEIQFESALTVIPGNQESISDLSWLEDSVFDNLKDDDFERPVDYMGRPMPGMNRSILEMQSMWHKVDKKSTGLELVENQEDVSREAREKNIDWDRVSRIAKTMLENRASLDTIENQLHKMVGNHPRIAAILQQLEPEYGLAGNVYITASLHPELKKVGGFDAFRKKFPTVKFIVASESHPVSQMQRTHGMSVVPSVPWEKALKLYTSRLEAQGKRVASNIDPKTALQMAFLSAPEEKKVAATNFPVHKERKVTLGEAIEALRAAKVSERVPFEKAIKQAQRTLIRKAIRKQASQFYDSGQITESEFQRLKNASSISEIHQYVNDKIQKSLVKSSEYKGSQHTAHYQSTVKKSSGADLGAFEANKARAVLVAYRQAGILTDAEVKKIESLPVQKQAPIAIKIATKKASESIHREYIPNIVKAYVGEGVFYRPMDHVARDPDAAAKSANMAIAASLDRAKGLVTALFDKGRITASQKAKLLAVKSPSKMVVLAKAAAAHAISTAVVAPSRGGYSGDVAKEHQGVGEDAYKAAQSRIAAEKDHWVGVARRIIASGLCGKSLTAELNRALPENVRTSIRDEVIELRKQFEGAAGIHYIDAAAYGGPDGCKTAQVKTAARVVLACNSCANCPHNRKGTCGIFRRKLANEVPVTLQQRKLAVKTANQRLVSATIDAPAFTDTFGLQNPEMSLNSSLEIDAMNISLEFNPVDGFDV